MNSDRHVLVTGVGGIGGVNFVTSLRLAEKQSDQKVRYFIVGTEYNKYYIDFAELDSRVKTPKHSDANFLPTIVKLLTQHKIQFIHPQPSVEAKVISSIKHDLPAKSYLPKPEDIMLDKHLIAERLALEGVPVPATRKAGSQNDIESAFADFGNPLWLRARSGAGGRLGLKVKSVEEANLWIKFNQLQGRASAEEFLIHEYLPGRDLAFDSLWHDGKLLLCFSRERLEYPLRNISLSGITGTPSVARILYESEITETGIAAVKALDPKPHGFFSVDMKEDADGRPKVTEVDGKWHTTAALWGYAFAKAYEKPELNLAHNYVEIGSGLRSAGDEDTIVDFFPKDHYLIRQMDSGVILKAEGDKTWKVL